ncbi:hypothetical protein HOD88_03205 [archaeon]|jgi:hypothetical protein|nr:hypothetical protein [archaeon]
MKKTTQDGQTFEQSGRSGLYLPANLRKEVYPTMRERFDSVRDNAKYALPVAVALTLLPTIVGAGTIYNATQSDETEAQGIVKVDSGRNTFVAQGITPW